MVTRDPLQFAKNLGDGATALKEAQKEAVTAAAQAAKQALADAPGAPRGKVAGKRVSVGYTISGLTATVRWRGPAHLVNNPTKAHLIMPRGFVGTRSVGKRAQKGAALLAAFGLDARAGQHSLRLGDGGFRREVHHPGTHGKFFFQSGRAVARRTAPDAYGKTNRAALAKSFTRG